MKLPFKIPMPAAMLLAVWIVGYVAIALSQGSTYPIWYSFAIFIGVGIGAAMDPAIIFPTVIAGVAAKSTKSALIFGLVIAVLVSVYVNIYGLIPHKGITIKAFVGRAVATSTIIIITNWVFLKVSSRD